MIEIKSNATRNRKDDIETTCEINIDGCKLELSYEFVGIMQALEEKHPDVFAHALCVFLREKGF